MTAGFLTGPTVANITDTSVSVSGMVATYTLPVWSTIPDQTNDALSLPLTLDLTAYVTSQTPITAWGTDVGTVDANGLLTIPAGTMAGANVITVSATNSAGQASAAPFTWTVTYQEYFKDFSLSDNTGWTHTRDSVATMHDYLGNIVTVNGTDADDEAFVGSQYTDPDTYVDHGVGYGIQLEAESTNVRFSSDDPSDTSTGSVTGESWQHNAVETVTQKAVDTSPHGYDGWLITPNTSSTWHGLRPLHKILTSGVTWTHTSWWKPNGCDWVQVTGSSGYAMEYCNINIRTGELGNNDISDFEVKTEPSTNGYMKVMVSATSTGTGVNRQIIHAVYGVDIGGRTQPWAGDGVSGALLAGMQIEEGYSTSYIPTITGVVGAVTRAATNLTAPFSALSPLPAGGVVNNYCAQSTIRLRHDVADTATYIVPINMEDAAKTGNERCQVYTDSTGVWKMQVVTDGVSKSVIGPTLLALAGDVIDVRLRKSSAEIAFWINGTKYSDTVGTEDHASPVSAVSVNQHMNVAQYQAGLEHQYTRIVPAALTDEDITGWQTWSEPVPEITQQPADIDFGGEAPGIPADWVFASNFKADYDANYNSDTDTLTGFYPHTGQVCDVLIDSYDGKPSLHMLMKDGVPGTYSTHLLHLTDEMHKGYYDVYIRIKYRFPDKFNWGQSSQNWKLWRMWQDVDPSGDYSDDMSTREDWKHFEDIWKIDNQHFAHEVASALAPIRYGIKTGTDYGITHRFDGNIESYTNAEIPGYFENVGSQVLGTLGDWELEFDGVVGGEKFVNNGAGFQGYHTIEQRIKLSSSGTADDGATTMWIDGVEVTNTNERWEVSTDPTYPSLPSSFSGNPVSHMDRAGINMIRIQSTFYEAIQQYWSVQGVEGGYYIRDIVVSTSRIGHDAVVSDEPILRKGHNANTGSLGYASTPPNDYDIAEGSGTGDPNNWTQHKNKTNIEIPCYWYSDVEATSMVWECVLASDGDQNNWQPAEAVIVGSNTWDDKHKNFACFVFPANFQTAWAGKYRCQIVDPTYGTNYSREHIINVV